MTNELNNTDLNADAPAELQAFQEAIEDFADEQINVRQMLVETPTTSVVSPMTLELNLKTVHDKFNANLVDEAIAYQEEEKRHAELLALGYSNALEWLTNLPHLFTKLVALGMTPAGDDRALLGQIAKMQLARYVKNKAGDPVLSVPSRRDERLGRFYRIFWDDKAKFVAADLERTILDHKGKSSGILAAAKLKPFTVSKQERADNYTDALKAPVVATVKTQAKIGKWGTYRLALVRIVASGFDVLELVEGQDTLVERVADKWAAATAATVSSEEEVEA